jgi:two-component sensor histidine kinase
VRYDAGTNLAEVVAVTPTLHELLGTRFPASQGLIGQIGKLRQGKIFTGAEVAEQAYGRVIRQSALRSVLAVPLMSRNELLGTLSLTRGAEAASDFGPADLELMEAFASRAAVAIDNAQLLKDLERKNRLLQLLIEEAHHRIKNNLQMISGLLQLEADVADPKAAEHLRTANSRLQAIAKVHNMLSSEMPEKVDAQALITTIAHTLTQSAQTRGGPPSVELDLVQLWLSAEQAVALALVVNELIANSLLHGRPCAGEALRLRVQCKQDGDQVSVTVCDNGGGFHPNADDQDPGQGMNIVAQLAQVNLRGSLQIQNREAGVCAELRFAVGSSAPPPSSASTEMAPSTRA